ncbi:MULTISPECIES: RolB family protein [Rhizobium/Agrobacterium group]|uniref:RolB family protein n=1 Tax=Rhizobium/Agrobacterium group TaxID=227290 RepID=UPI001ADAEA37|nr:MULTISPECIES: RolB family protein [Rhizobium/Agrobacterium group]MBO9112543.1 hypothetical protein [Agrobacterium sp. S2/73]QXZ76049.1 hypothetical protein J5276_28695 [Agrobacterium sp. S7/73]QYA16941.1 hypothetical protein J5284_32815 [Rhizobium sp. AB2/73]UEQ85486.1 hypothetical protein I8E17_31245 [Rhizobium sp. AB2/73]
MTAPQWAVRDFTFIFREQELRIHLEQAETDYSNTMRNSMYFHPSELNPGEFDDEYIMNDQYLSFVYADETTARHCALYRLLPSSSSNHGAVATEIAPWMLTPQQLNYVLQQRCDQGGLINYYHGPSTNLFYLAIMRSSMFVRFGTEVIEGENYGFFARGGNYVEERAEDAEVEEEEDGEEEQREHQIGDLIHYPIIAVGSCDVIP